MTVSKQEILDAFWFRHACKEFDASRAISDEDFAFILETARLSPSSFGLEPWKFLIIQNAELREKMLGFTWGGQKQLPSASHVIITIVRKSYFMRYDSPYLYHFMRKVQQFPEPTVVTRAAIIEKFQRDDFDLLASDRTLSEWAIRQTYIPLANMMTAAALIGIDSCPIEGFERESLNQFLNQHLAIDLNHWEAAYILAFGYRIQQPTRSKTRQTITDVVKWFK